MCGLSQVSVVQVSFYSGSVQLMWLQYLDEVVVEMETCDTPRDPETASPMAGYR